MSIKQLCFDAHGQLRDQRGIAVRRAHLYELLAALLGFNSHAEVAAEAVIGQLRQARKISQQSALAEAIRYALTRWTALTRYVAEGRIEIDNNAAERVLRAVTIGCNNSR